MKAFQIIAADRRAPDSDLDKCLVIANDFDSARRSAIEYLEREWPGVPIELSKIEKLNYEVVLADGLTQAKAEATA